MTAIIYDFDAEADRRAQREADERAQQEGEELPRVSAMAIIDVTRMRLHELRPYVRVGHTAAIDEVRRRGLESAIKNVKGGAR